MFYIGLFIKPAIASGFDIKFCALFTKKKIVKIIKISNFKITFASFADFEASQTIHQARHQVQTSTPNQAKQTHIRLTEKNFRKFEKFRKFQQKTNKPFQPQLRHLHQALISLHSHSYCYHSISLPSTYKKKKKN